MGGGVDESQNVAMFSSVRFRLKILPTQPWSSQGLGGVG